MNKKEKHTLEIDRIIIEKNYVPSKELPSQADSKILISLHDAYSDDYSVLEIDKNDLNISNNGFISEEFLFKNKHTNKYTGDDFNVRYPYYAWEIFGYKG